MDPLSVSCMTCRCMGIGSRRHKGLKYARSWTAEKIFHVPQKLDKILAVSDFERSRLQAHFGSSAHVETLYNPVSPASEIRQEPWKSKNYVWIGRMTMEKDPITPARICHELGVSLTLVGDGPLEAEVRASNPNANLVGWLGADGVRVEQCRSRALIMSSKCYETASLVVLECLAAGIPCVVPSMSAATSWVEDGVNGLTFDIQDSSSLKRALERLDDDDFVEQLSLNAFTRYWKEPFSLARYRESVLQHYQEAMGA